MSWSSWTTISQTGEMWRAHMRNKTRTSDLMLACRKSRIGGAEKRSNRNPSINYWEDQEGKYFSLVVFLVNYNPIDRKVWVSHGRCFGGGWRLRRDVPQLTQCRGTSASQCHGIEYVRYYCLSRSAAFLLHWCTTLYWNNPYKEFQFDLILLYLS